MGAKGGGWMASGSDAAWYGGGSSHGGGDGSWWMEEDDNTGWSKGGAASDWRPDQESLASTSWWSSEGGYGKGGKTSWGSGYDQPATSGSWSAGGISGASQKGSGKTLAPIGSPIGAPAAKQSGSWSSSSTSSWPPSPHGAAASKGAPTWTNGSQPIGSLQGGGSSGSRSTPPSWGGKGQHHETPVGKGHSSHNGDESPSGGASQGYMPWRSLPTDTIGKSRPYDRKPVGKSGSEKDSRKGSSTASAWMKGGGPQPPRPVQTPHTVVLFSTHAMDVGFEQQVEDAARSVAINAGFSVADQVRRVTSHTCFIDFPHDAAVKAFMEATGAKLTVQSLEYRLEASRWGNLGEREEDYAKASEFPTDTLIVQRIWDLSEETVKAAFAAVGTVTNIKIPKNWAGKPKSFAFIQFPSVSEAGTAQSRFQAAGCMIGDRKVNVSYAQPESAEAFLQAKAKKQAEEAQLLENTKQALNGINGDMWAEYLRHVNKAAD